MSRQAEADFTSVLEDLGLGVHAAAPDSGADLIVDVDDTTVLVNVKAVALATPQRAADVASARRDDGQVIPVLVADSIAAAAKEILRAEGWGWLDRRHGHLVLRGRGLLLDTTVPCLQRPRRIVLSPLAGRAAKSYAAALLMTPEAPPSMRDVARRSGMASATIGEAAQRLRAAALIRDDGRPLYPELFWELAGAWSEYQPVPLQHLPRQADLAPPVELAGKPGELHTLGPALSGTAAALAYDAPLAVAGDVPPDFYLPNSAAVSSFVRRLGRAERFEDRACTITVAPIQQVCEQRLSIPAKSPWPLVHPLFVALDLAQDHTRGREILEGFTPPQEFTRVW
jgi:hypothetical protein